MIGREQQDTQNCWQLFWNRVVLEPGWVSLGASYTAVVLHCQLCFLAWTYRKLEDKDDITTHVFLALLTQNFYHGRDANPGERI